MPIHDWTRAPSGYFHHFHQRWTGAICDALNTGVLPKGVFALVEQYSGAIVPDVLALKTQPLENRDWSTSRGGVALATETPKTRFISREEGRVGVLAHRFVARNFRWRYKSIDAQLSQGTSTRRDIFSHARHRA